MASIALRAAQHGRWPLCLTLAPWFFGAASRLVCLLQVAWNVILCRIASSSSTPPAQGRLKPEPKCEARDKPLKVRFPSGSGWVISFSAKLFAVVRLRCVPHAACRLRCDHL